MAETISANYPAALADNTSLLGDHVNQKSLILSGSHNTSVTTITTTANISGVNAPGYCLIDSELIHFTGVSGATLTTATRGANATTAATHADAATIYFVPVANWANQVKREIVATQTELGTDPAGAFADVDTSLNTWLLGVTDGITAGSTQSQAGATALTKGINRVTVVGTNGDGVKLPTAVAGLQILIINDDSAQTIQVWPATGDAIDGGSANAVDGSQIGVGSARRYIAVDATNWYTATATGAVTSVSGSTGAVADGDIDHDSLANFTASEHFTQANITTIGTVTSGTISTGAVIADATMTLGSDADGDMYYRASNVLTRLAKGSDNDTLMMNGNVPNWEAVAAAGGLTEADSWKLTTSFAGDADPIAANLARVTKTGFGKLGTGMAESSGIFTFPSTGYWAVLAQFYQGGAYDSAYNRGIIRVTADADNGNTYEEVSYNNNAQTQYDSAHMLTSVFVYALVDVTSVAAVKVSFGVYVINKSVDTSQNQTVFHFIRLGDT